MSLPDEETIEAYLRRYRETVPAPRAEWVRYGEETLARQARKMKRTEKINRVMTYTLSTSAAVLIGVWVQGIVVEKANVQPAADHGQRESAAAASDAHLLPGIFHSPDAPSHSAANRGLAPYAERGLVLPQTANEPETGMQKPAAGNVGKSPERTAYTEELPSSGTGGGMLAAAQKPEEKRGLEKQAEKYLQEKLGEESKQYRFNPARSRLAEGIVSFSRVVDGIPVDENSLVVKINQSSEVVGMEIYPIAQKAFSAASVQRSLIDQEEAAQKLATTLRLVYTAGEEPVLRYQPLQAGYVDALTGKLAANADQGSSLIPIQSEGKRLRATDAGSAADLLRAEFGVKISAGIEPVRMINDSSFEYLWEWDGGKSARIRMDKAGNILSFASRNAVQKAGNKQLGMKEAQQTAIEKLSRYLPAGVEEVEMIGQTEEGQQTLFRFCWVHQGIPVITHSYDVYVDRTSGTVTGMAGPFGAELPRLPKAQDVISPEEAMKIFAQQAQPEPVYRALSGQRKSDAEVQLVYPYPVRNEQPLAVDAKTGTLVQP
ncbi:YcdB/YcdC domain-containing protein [Brevibacillus borstelensis]|uniref:YcdB/YcdC domain-containing protein n=1 Tax=Brevibacillus borstelensis TaxID=45462 RepID=UPI0030C56563